MAKPYPYNDSAQALYFPAEGPPFFENWDRDTDTSNDDLLCAEMARLAYAAQGPATAALSSIGFALKKWIGGPHGTDGFIATSSDHRVMVLAFRGTETKPEDVLADGFAVSGPWVKTGQVHQGFARAYGGVRDEVNAVLAEHQGTLLITGHSLGAALATLAAADQADREPEPPTLITFGSPLVGDTDFSGSLQGLVDGGNIKRFVDCCDLVTRIPPEEFSQSKIAELLVDLVPEGIKGTVPAIATGLSIALLVLGIQPHYVHVVDEQYRDRRGLTLAAGTTRAQDQAAARAAYGGSLVPDPNTVVGQAQAAFTAASGAKGLRDAIRVFARELFQGGRVPIRDLADHAPINYVSLFSGRV